MLADIILNMIYGVVAGFMNLFPNVSFSDGIGSAILSANGYISGLGAFIPLTTLFSILGLFLTIEGVILSINIINWFIRKIPAIN